MSVACAWGNTARAGEQAREQEQHRQERVAAEDVGHGELVVAEPHRRDPGRDLRQRRGRREDRRAEDDAGHAEVVGDLLAALLEDDAGGERDRGADPEDGARARERHSALRDFEWPRRLLLAVWRGAGRVVPRQPAPRAIDEPDADDPEDGDQERGRLDPREERVAGELRAHDRDREHEDHEQPLEPEHERRRPRSQRRLPADRDVEDDEHDGLDRDPAEDVPDRDPEAVRERRRDDDRDLRQVRRDREQDRAAERLAQAEPRVEHVRRARKVDARDPDGARGDGEDQDERGEAQAREQRFGQLKDSSA